MEFKANALCVRAVDYKENDRLLTLCTLERGKILAKIAGCKAPKSKLRFAASPLCFGEYMLTERNGYCTVIGCTEYDGFYDVTLDIDRYYAAFLVLECTEKLSKEEAVDGTRGAVLLAINALKTLSYDTDVGADAVLIDYLTAALTLTGYGLNLDKCALTGRPLEGRVFFDFVSGGIIQNSESADEALPLSAAGFRRLRGQNDEQAEAYVDKEVVHFLAEILCERNGFHLKTLKNLL